MTATARPAWRDALAIVAGVGAVATATWLVPASVHIVRWSAAGPTRVALFAPPSRLAWIAAIAGVCLAGVFAWTGRDSDRLARAAARLRPLSLLWAWAVPFLPWLPDRIPLLLVLGGPARWAIAAFAFGSALGMVARLKRLGDLAAHRVGRRTVFAITLIAYLAFGTLWYRTIGIGGDEPHYLMITQSLLADRDLLIENNHDNKEYHAFFGGPLRPDFMVRGKDGLIYSIHAPGLSAILLPAYAVAGYAGSLLVVCLIGAFMAVAVFDLADAVAGRRAALFTWAAICFTVPIVPAAWLIYPDTAGALVVAWAALWLWQPVDARSNTWFWRGAALATLPWLHTKFVVFLALFAAALAFQLRRHVRALAAMSAPIALSLAAWLWYFYAIYGTFDPQAPYGTYTSLVQPRYIPRGLLGLLFDQKFGFFVYGPVYLAAIVGSWTLIRRADFRFPGIVLIATAALFTASSARMYMWWGGSSAPARFLVPLIPCLTPMIALAVADARRRWMHPVFTVCLLFSVGLALTAAFLPEQRLVYSDPHGSARLFQWLQAGSPLADAFPTFTPPDWWSPFKELLPWIAATGAAFATVAVASRMLRSDASIGPGFLGGAVFLLVAGVGTASPEAALRDATARRGTSELLWQWDPGRRRAFEYGHNARLDTARLRELSVLTWHGPADAIALPSGTYEARVWFAGAAAREGEIRVKSEQNAVFGRTTGALQNPTTVPFVLPSDAPSVLVSAVDKRLGERLASVEIVPLDVAPVSQRDGLTVRAVDSVEESPNGYVVYVDSTTYPEGGVFWTRGTDLATVYVAPGGARRLVLTMFLGPQSGEVRVTVAGNTSQVRVEANQVAQFEADLPHSTRLVPIQIQSPGQFHPADVDASSDDTRRLGCQVRVGLY